MLRLVVALVCLFFLVQLSVPVDADVICPPAEAISPCTCREYTTTTTNLFCREMKLTDSQVSDILDAYLTTPNVSQVGQLLLNYNELLTRVPVQMKSFTQLSETFLSYNSFTSIELGAFNFTDDANPLHYLDLGFNQLTTIAPGAFKGSNFSFRFRLFAIVLDRFISAGIKAIANNTRINLYVNQLTRFESTVFQSLLDKMASFGGYPNAFFDIYYSKFLFIIMRYKQQYYMMRLMRPKQLFFLFIYCFSFM